MGDSDWSPRGAPFRLGLPRSARRIRDRPDSGHQRARGRAQNGRRRLQ